MKKQSAASKIEIDEPLKPARAVRRKGKKSVPYYDDPEILKRLARVAEMMAKGKYAHEIAAELGCALGTAKRDISRVRELWKAESRENITFVKEESINVYRRVQIEAWGKMKDDPQRAHNYMTVVLSAQEKIDRLNGAGEPEPTKDVGVNVTVEIKDIEAVRESRWKNVEDRLIQIAQRQEETPK